MGTVLFHALIGNDTHPALVAAARAVLGSFILGGLGLLAMWATTDEVKVLIIAGLTPFLTNLGLRFGFEGFIDVRKNGKQ